VSIDILAMSASHSIKRRESFKRARARRPSFLDHADWMVEKKPAGTDVEKAVASYWDKLLSNKDTHKDKDTADGFFCRDPGSALDQVSNGVAGFQRDGHIR